MSSRASSHTAPASDPSGQEKQVVLTPEFLAQADAIVSHYPASKRSASLPLLHHWQETFGYVSAQGIDWIASKLELQPINILEIVTFYPMLRQQAAGRLQIKVCRTLSCALQGAYELCHHLKQRCGTTEEAGHGISISPDGKYSVEFVECLASCHTAPVMMVNEELHESVTITGAEKILSTF